MLKVLFAGGSVAGFVLAVALGFGFNPVSAHGHSSSTAKSNVSAPSKATLNDKKDIVPAITSAASSILGTNGTNGAPAIDAASIANSLSSLTGGSATSTASTATGGSDMSGLLNQFSGIVGGGSASNIGDISSFTGGAGDLNNLAGALGIPTGGNTNGNGKHNSKNAGNDFNLNDLTNLIGGGH